jgi:hypothetical protein
MTRFTTRHVAATLADAQEALDLAHRIQVGLIQASGWLWRRGLGT